MKRTQIPSLIVLFVLLVGGTGCQDRCAKVEDLADRAKVAYDKILRIHSTAQDGVAAACLAIDPDGAKCAAAREWFDQITEKLKVGQAVLDLARQGVALFCPPDGARVDARAVEEFDLDALKAMVLALEESAL